MSALEGERQVSELDRSTEMVEARRVHLGAAHDRDEGLDGSAGYADSGEGVDAPFDA